LQLANAVIREKSRLAEDRSWLSIASSEGSTSSTLDWFQNVQNTSQSSWRSETELTKASRLDCAVPSFTRTSALPPPPANIDNLNLSQAFQTSCSSSQPAANSAYVDFRNNDERSESSDFVSPNDVGVSRKGSGFAGSVHPKVATIFKVPYRNTKPIAEVSRQEAVTVASGQQLNLGQRETAYEGKYQAGNANGLNSKDLSTDDKLLASQKPTRPQDNSDVIAKTPYIQPSFTGDHASALPFPQETVVSSSTSLRDHVGNTPLTLSGMLT